MFRQLVISISFCLLLGCINNSLYTTAKKSGYGYSEKKLEQDRYRIQFVARGDNMELAREHALLRAAEICLQEKYAWFEIEESSENIIHDNKMDPSLLLPLDIDKMGGNCDLPSCGNKEEHRSTKGSNLELGDTIGKVISGMDIKLLTLKPASNTNIYSARETYKMLKKKLVDEKAVN